MNTNFVSARSLGLPRNEVRLTATESASVVAHTFASARQLHSPFFDLEGAGKTLSSLTLAECVARLGTEASSIVSQGTTRRNFRRDLLSDLQLTQLRPDLDWPPDLEPTARSLAWQSLVDSIDNWRELPLAHRVHVVTLLNKLSLYSAARRLMSFETFDRYGDELGGLLELKRIVAQSKLAGVDEATVRDLVALADAGAPIASLHSASLLVVLFGRFQRDEEALRFWSARALHAASGFDTGTSQQRLMWTIVLRATSFVPMLDRDERGVWAMLDEAESLGQTLRGDESIPLCAAEENLYALAETRSNSAFQLGDEERGMRCRREMVDLDPLDQRTHIKYGIALMKTGDVEGAHRSFIVAGTLGAPYCAEAWFQAGQCLESLGHTGSAMELYLRSLDADPTAISSLLAVRRLATRGGQMYVEVSAQLDRLHGRLHTPTR